MPFDGLDVGVLVTAGCGEGVCENEGTDGVSSAIRTVGIEFSSGIIGSEVNEGLVDVSGDLDVIWRLDELNASECALGNGTSAMGRFCAPGDALSLHVTNQTVRSSGAPETEIIETVDDSRLAHGVLVLGGGVANVVSLLGASLAVSGIDLPWQSGIRICLVGESESVDDRRLSNDLASGGDCQEYETFRDHRLFRFLITL